MRVRGELAFKQNKSLDQRGVSSCLAEHGDCSERRGCMLAVVPNELA